MGLTKGITKHVGKPDMYAGSQGLHNFTNHVGVLVPG